MDEGEDVLRVSLKKKRILTCVYVSTVEARRVLGTLELASYRWCELPMCVLGTELKLSGAVASTSICSAQSLFYKQRFFFFFSFLFGHRVLVCSTGWY